MLTFASSRRPRAPLRLRRNLTALRIVCFAAAAVLSACATSRLALAPDAQHAPGRSNVGVAESAGVRITAQANAWNGTPQNLSSEITPLRVSIENHSNRPLRVRYNDFSLASNLGYRYAALPPYRIRGSVAVNDVVPPFAPRFAYSHFYVAPYYSPYFTTLPAWDYPWAFDGYYYNRWYPMWHLELPTRDMRELAIPEGVIDPQGSVSGFLYFPKLSGGADRVTLVAALTDGKSGEGFGELSIPFVVK